MRVFMIGHLSFKVLHPHGPPINLIATLSVIDLFSHLLRDGPRQIDSEGYTFSITKALYCRRAGLLVLQEWDKDECCGGGEVEGPREWTVQAGQIQGGAGEIFTR